MKFITVRNQDKTFYMRLPRHILPELPASAVISSKGAYKAWYRKQMKLVNKQG